MLERIFGSSTRVKILKFFCLYANRSCYVRELARILDVRVSALSRELENLTSLGFLKTHIANAKKYYAVNPDFELVNELTALLLKSVVLLERAVIADMRTMPGIHLFLLTGIFVTQNTGTDIVLVGKLNKAKVQAVIAALSRAFHQPLRFTYFNPTEYKYRVAVSDKFLSKVLHSSPIIVINKYATVQKA